MGRKCKLSQKHKYSGHPANFIHKIKTIHQKVVWVVSERKQEGEGEGVGDVAAAVDQKIMEVESSSTSNNSIKIISTRPCKIWTQNI